MIAFVQGLKDLSNKYLDYFNNQTIDNHLEELLSDVDTVANLLGSEFRPPIEILKEVMEKFGYKESFYEHIIDIKDYYSSLSPIELFTLLYFCTCRNIFIFDNDFYISSIKNGCIFSLLNEINKKIF